MCIYKWDETDQLISLLYLYCLLGDYLSLDVIQRPSLPLAAGCGDLSLPRRFHHWVWQLEVQPLGISTKPLATGPCCLCLPVPEQSRTAAGRMPCMRSAHHQLAQTMETQRPQPPNFWGYPDGIWMLLGLTCLLESPFKPLGEGANLPLSSCRLQCPWAASQLGHPGVAPGSIALPA